jgi:hypothetical protein
MRGRRLHRTAMGVFAIILIAGCGAATPVRRATVATVSSWIRTTAPSQSVTTADEYDSARYCQQLPSGSWVTNDSPDSTTPCVPDPAYATGDEQSDASQALPRCATCTLAEWERAERKKAQQATGLSGGSANTDTTDSGGWSAEERAQILDTCSSRWDAREDFCGCIVDDVAHSMSVYEASELAADDRIVRAAAAACDPESEQP